MSLFKVQAALRAAESIRFKKPQMGNLKNCYVKYLAYINDILGIV